MTLNTVGLPYLNFDYHIHIFIPYFDSDHYIMILTTTKLCLSIWTITPSPWLLLDYHSLTKARIMSLTTTGLPYLNINYHIVTLNSTGLLYFNLDYHSLTLTAILW